MTSGPDAQRADRSICWISRSEDQRGADAAATDDAPHTVPPEPFRGRVTNVFAIGDRGTALMLTEIEGRPEVGMTLRVGKRRCLVIELGRNSTDGEVVSTRACLTGRPVAPYGAVAVAWTDGAGHSAPRAGEWAREEGRGV